MKVALLSDCYLPRLGGIESQVSDLAVHLARAGHEVEVFTATAGAQGQVGGVIEDVDGIPVHRLATKLTMGVPINPLATSEVRHRLRHGGFDVAHAHMGVISPFAVDTARLALLLRIPTAVTWHSVIDRAAPWYAARKTFSDWAQQGAALSAVSTLAAEHVTRVVGDDVPITVLHNGIDLSTWRAAAADRAQRHVGDDLALAQAAGVVSGGGAREVHLVTATRLAPRKRPDVLLDLVARARERVPATIGMQLDVLGEGPMRRQLGRRLRRLGIGDWARLRGRVPRADLVDLYRDAHVYLSPTRLEAFGVAALEARTAGLPVIAMAESGVRDIIEDGVNGLLARDDDHFVDQIVRLVTDHALRGEIALRNATIPPVQSWDTVVDLVEAEYLRAGA
ncbi:MULTISPECIES: glycosyltransferase family 4 protein [unclassified Janibacter]|uniref:glycosyltransferase family 4 protein n=1 Tax=unclassified Janibacter TaxID=2649294 RepID=UPI003CFBCAE7